MAETKKHTGWTICCALAIIIMLTAFTPLFLPAGESEPRLAGMPYTLWSGIGLCMVMVVLTAVATIVHPGGRRKVETADNEPA
ncbi:hypothetical protein [Lewinella sp. IMCC34191]|uniref:hypothetical protein n=1 Tax=Lewinella sp. IMCC34191 TaxID=2259172 RepID=UPI000E2376DC|nr:hypothetical protein [Lewinella sp. IMCC34191]